jgi:hypothetical protein
MRKRISEGSDVRRAEMLPCLDRNAVSLQNLPRGAEPQPSYGQKLP